MIRKTLRSLFLILILTASLFACKPAEKQAQKTESEAYKPLAAEKLGPDAEFTFNEDRSFVLAQSMIEASKGGLSFSFFVFDMKNEKIVLEQQVESGYVKWLSKTEIEIFRTPGIMRQDQTRDDYTQVHNVLTGESMPKTDWKKLQGG